MRDLLKKKNKITRGYKNQVFFANKYSPYQVNGVRDLSFSTCTKLCQKLSFLTPWYVHEL